MLVLVVNLPVSALWHRDYFAVDNARPKGDAEIDPAVLEQAMEEPLEYELDASMYEVDLDVVGDGAVALVVGVRRVRVLTIIYAGDDVARVDLAKGRVLDA
jgi:hypothetical protein